MQSGELREVSLEKKEGVAYVILNRPHVQNALSPRMVDELVYVWGHVRDDPQVQVIILTGAGEDFQNGRGDVEALVRSLDSERLPPTRPYRYSWNTPVSPKAHELFKPVIVAVNGVCATGGLELVAEADIVICSQDATFFDNHVSYGAMVHSAVALSKRLSYNHIIRMALMGAHEVIDARRAFEIGLVSEVTEPVHLIPRAKEIAKAIMLNSPTAVQASVEVLWNSMSLGLRDAMQLDSYMQRHYNTHPDRIEAIKSLLDHRESTWQEADWHSGH